MYHKEKLLLLGYYHNYSIDNLGTLWCTAKELDGDMPNGIF